MFLENEEVERLYACGAKYKQQHGTWKSSNVSASTAAEATEPPAEPSLSLSLSYDEYLERSNLVPYRGWLEGMNLTSTGKLRQEFADMHKNPKHLGKSTLKN